MKEIRRGRRTLVLIAIVFTAPIVIATVLAFSGWLPQGRRNYGDLVDPPLRIEVASAALDGKPFAWTTPQWHWTLVVRIPEHCAADCRGRLDRVNNLRVSLGRHAAKLRIVSDRALPAGVALGEARGVYLLSELPAGIAATLPEPREDLVIALVDPAGYLMLCYPEHADLSRVRKDLGRLIR